jgi:hypothetical protein
MRLPRREDPPAHGPVDDPDQDFPEGEPARQDPPPEGPGPDVPVREPEQLRAPADSAYPSSWSASCAL